MQSIWIPIIKLAIAGMVFAVTNNLDMRFSLNRVLKVILLIVVIGLSLWAIYDLFKLAGF